MSDLIHARYRVLPVLTLIAGLALAPASFAQDGGMEEIVVTGSRIAGAPAAAPLPAVTIRKRADFLLQAVAIENDTREARGRRDETYQTLRGMLQAAARVPGLSIAVQKGFLETVTENNHEIPLDDDGDRDDTSSATIFVKVALTAQSDVARSIKTLQDFVTNARRVGRTTVEPQGEVALSVVNPERYRPEVMAALANSVKEMRAAFGDRCRIQLGDLSRRLLWQRTEVSELTLYLPYEMRIDEC